MEVIRKRARHEMLMGRMADTLGVDLQEAAMRGRLDAADTAMAVARCTGCEGGSDCPDWLAAHEAGAIDTPDYCRNRALFAALAGR